MLPADANPKKKSERRMISGCIIFATEGIKLDCLITTRKKVDPQNIKECNLRSLKTLTLWKSHDYVSCVHVSFSRHVVLVLLFIYFYVNYVCCIIFLINYFLLVEFLRKNNARETTFFSQHFFKYNYQHCMLLFE